MLKHSSRLALFLFGVGLLLTAGCQKDIATNPPPPAVLNARMEDRIKTNPYMSEENKALALKANASMGGKSSSVAGKVSADPSGKPVAKAPAK
ncbi:MAG: hypothetical protein H7145_20970 [Akkermansiaceae bacterium]|nr:hypothetical protein [Armatimonadota bacterium]